MLLCFFLLFASNSWNHPNSKQWSWNVKAFAEDPCPVAGVICLNVHISADLIRNACTSEHGCHSKSIGIDNITFLAQRFPKFQSHGMQSFSILGSGDK